MAQSKLDKLEKELAAAVAAADEAHATASELAKVADELHRKVNAERRLKADKGMPSVVWTEDEKVARQAGRKPGSLEDPCTMDPKALDSWIEKKACKVVKGAELKAAREYRDKMIAETTRGTMVTKGAADGSSEE